MTLKKKVLWGACVAAVIVFLYMLLAPAGTGTSRFYADQPYHFQVMRAMGDIPFGAGEAGEILSTIKNIPEGDDEAWFREWDKTAVRVEKAARGYRNATSKGYGLLRAHSYYRTAEFFMGPGDDRRLASFDRNRRAFYDGLDALGVRYTVVSVPYGNNTLKAIYYPGDARAVGKPLILMCGGYDSTLEELYFMLARGALDRGYSCLTFEGPGQGSIIREQGLQFTHEWEKPTGAVLDAFLARYPKPPKIVYVGGSLGGYLAPRAAAFDARIDGVVAFDVCYDFQEAALRQVPWVIRSMYGMGMTGLVNGLIKLKMKNTPGVRWGVQNAQWTMGAKDPVDLLSIFSKYSLKDVSDKIRGDVLILAGEKDHFFPVTQVEEFRKALVNARSVTTRVFTEQEGGHEHCQLGALSLMHAVLFEWVEEKFGR